MKPSYLRWLQCYGLVAIGILVAAGCSSQPDAAVAPPVPAGSPDPQLTWGNAAQVSGTQVMRIDLVRQRSGLSCGYGELRNILFLDPADKAGHWLLPDSQHFFAASLELVPSEAKHTLGTVALVKDAGHDSEIATGKLLVFDPVGRIVEPLAEGVRRLNVASVAPTGDFVVLYECSRQFVTAVVDGRTFKSKQQQVFDIPTLK